MKIKYKMWLEKETGIMGDGSILLLKLIDKTGSISKAAQEMNISYRKAWNRIRKMEERYKKPLVKTHSGGETGGGSSLTEEGIQLVKKYTLFRNEVDREVERLFKKYF